MTESAGTVTSSDIRVALRFLFEFVFPPAIAGCALLVPLLIMGMQTDYDLGVSLLGLFTFSAFSFWPVPLLACLLFKRRRLRLLLIWWGALFISWQMGRTSFFVSPIELIPEPLNMLLFFFTGAVLLWVVILRALLKNR